MVTSDRHSTGIDRRASVRSSLQDNGSDGDDDDLTAMGVSDRFRRPGVDAGHTRLNSQSSQSHDRPQGRRTPPPRPSSATKPRYESFALRHDGATSPLSSRHSTIASTSSVPVTRSSSVSTEMAFVRAESPYRGPTGPSHPYQMYPQESRLARTASMATTSTVQVPERSYAGPSGPTHPYGMYPQNTVPEAEDSSDGDVIVPAPVGFPGRNHDYHRRLGPEGEEIADIIGPDGHTEQLPPYSQYPDEAFARKIRPAAQPLLTGAGGIGLATRDPEFASREDLTTPQSHHSSRSLVSESSSQINTAASGESEKPRLKKWQEVARRRVCGIIPIWAFVLVGAAFILFAILMGSVFAALKPKHHPPPNYNDDTADRPKSIIITTMTTTYDATPFTAPSEGIPTAPTGTYRLPISTPSIAPASCLSNLAQSAAWSCAIPAPLPYIIDIINVPGSDNLSNVEMKMDYGNATVAFLPYGAQPPIFNDHKVMRLVEDVNYPERGPAWFFQATYDKVVILPQVALATSPTTSRRYAKDKRDISAPGFSQKAVAQVGEMPWICYWNATLLEAFIYVNQTSISGKTPVSTPTSIYGQPPASTTSTSEAGGATSATSSDNGNYQYYENLPGYPKMVKIEERRLPIPDQNIQPYCIQNVVNSDGSYQPVMDGNLPVTLYLTETVPATAEPMADDQVTYRSMAERESELAERQSAAICGCTWLKQ